MGKVQRHLFVPAAQQPDAYDNRPLPIGHGQTISQPYIVALMTDLLRPEPGHVVLEIGTGSGYQAAVLAELTRRCARWKSSNRSESWQKNGSRNSAIATWKWKLPTAITDGPPGALRWHHRHRGRESRSGVAGAATETRRAHGYTVGTSFLTQQLMMIEKGRTARW